MEEITSGIPSTSVMMAAAKTMMSNEYIRFELHLKNGRLDHSLIPYYENVYKKESSMSKAINFKICCFDPYAYYFLITKESIAIIGDAININIKQCSDFAQSQSFKNHLVKKGLSPEINAEELENYLLKECSPVKAWSYLIFDSLNIRVAVRTNIAGGQCRQFVNLGAGLDTRALRLPFGSDSTVWEVDFAPVLNFKKKVLEQAKEVIPPLSKARNVYIRSDVLKVDYWIDKLIASGFQQDKPTFWLMEGLIMYFTEQEIEYLLSRISAISASGSSLFIQTLCPKVDKDQTNVYAFPLRDEFKSYTNTPATYFTNSGFTNELITKSEEELKDLFQYVNQIDIAETNTLYTIGYKP
ncbi:hypothetical protein PPL_03443 [Heterostelium album PN500]|uniref:S-adenosyl-L-methionine-dependent methyltransferase n=1 Tax=Heterostelium pallidum (strain ATCC 26659 / Pp 5 / PN500) TaxID=670386 RepID=D3B4W7_HETP5|nr:hypothetical protein PPL_03443 [Heterostelium album PN500]EFA84365.1 hypothetical protein PPL_03443 [Heterostelium album PN500]|eukprot:XP_020436480.1 hypothetical protein PPL_03443 [Heterostelium album PN500]